MSWKDIIKEREGYTEEELEELHPNWEDFLMEIEEQDPKAIAETEGKKKGASSKTQFGDYEREESILIFKDTWDKYVNDKKWVASLDWKPAGNTVNESPERQYNSVNREAPDWHLDNMGE